MLKRKNGLLSIVLSLTFSWLYATLPCNFNKLSVLTHPIGISGNMGHRAVASSLLRGLKLLAVTHNVNPTSFDDLGDVVHVVSGGIRTVKQIVPQVKSGRVKTLIVGPNLGLSQRERGELFRMPEIGAILVPSEWVKKPHVKRYPWLNSSLCVWFSGVDPSYWSAETNVPLDSKKVALYVKKVDEKLVQAVENILKKYGWEPYQIRYGSYNHTQYKTLLQESRFIVFLSKTESQGIALAEAWSMDVPTLVWNSRAPLVHAGATFPETSACPYLTDATGVDWQTLNEFDALIASIDERLPYFTPRRWVLDTMSDVASVKLLLAIINRRC